MKRILLAQLLVFLALVLALSLPAIARRLVPRRIQRAGAHRVASEQFMIRGVSRKANRAGVLIFVSLAERYARIVADEGIAQKVEQKVWQGAIDTLRAHAGDGRLADGLVEAIGQCGAVLATHFPSEDGKDELPDRVFVI